jgi:exportin-T
MRETLGNKPHFQSLLQSIVHYIGSDSLLGDQRAGFIVINKLVSLWLPSTPDCAQAGAPTIEPPVDGFEKFLYDNVVKLCFDIPLRKDFDLGGDAQSFQVGFFSCFDCACPYECVC